MVKLISNRPIFHSEKNWFIARPLTLSFFVSFSVCLFVSNTLQLFNSLIMTMKTKRKKFCIQIRKKKSPMIKGTGVFSIL